MNILAATVAFYEDVGLEFTFFVHALIQHWRLRSLFGRHIDDLSIFWQARFLNICTSASSLNQIFAVLFHLALYHGVNLQAAIYHLSLLANLYRSLFLLELLLILLEIHSLMFELEIEEDGAV